MKLRTLLLVALALLCGVSAAVGVNQLRQPADIEGAQTVAVVTMAANLPRGVLVTEKDIRIG